MQNDILRICNKTKLSDKVTLVELHKKCKILSLRQRMEKQLLGLMYNLSKDKSYHHVPGRNTRRADRITFKVPAKIRPIYEHSPYYIGSKMWDTLEKTVQTKDDIYAFKKELCRMYKTYKKI